MSNGLEQLKSIKSFPSLVKYLRDELDWPIESDDVEDLTFEYEPEELGLDKQTAVKIKEIKQLRPLANNQPWGIFYINFEPKRLPIVALRRILRSLVIKKRASANRAQRRAWRQNDLLFISSYGETDGREMTFAHFSENSEIGDLPTLKVLGWSTGNTILRLEDTHRILKEKLHWPEDETDADEWRKEWSSAFKLQYRETVRTSKDLAVKLAKLAEDIRERVNEVLSVESERGELRKLYKAFQEALIHDLSEDDFADMYAQTIAYGLLSASISRQSGALVADNLKDMVPNTNPFLKELMQTFLTVGGRKGKIDFDELGINEVVELLRHTQMDEVLKDFGAKNPQEDPVIHFYELFLKEYDPEKRMKRGVFYTPRPIVGFIVRSVDEILRTEFELEDGLADTTTWGEMVKRHDGLTIPEGVKSDEPFVQILDPATGTGTFLVEVIDLIYKTMRAKWERQGKREGEIRELWNDYVPRHLLPRLHGFELMMAPYAIAHMKIGLKLTETKYNFLSSERARIYLTNTLEEPKDFSSYFEQMAPALAHEAQDANKIKRSAPITVVIGNPPYSNYSANLTPEARAIVNKYRTFKGVPIRERNQLQFERNLQDDFVKFIAYGENHIAAVGVGVVSMITNAVILTSNSLRGVREHLLNTFNRVAELHLHGGTNEKLSQADQNVFEIEQMVAIHNYASLPTRDSTEIKFAELVGAREAKYNALAGLRIYSDAFKPVTPDEANCGFSPTGKSGEERLISLKDCFIQYGAGIKTNRDSIVISFDEPSLIKSVRRFRPDLVDTEEKRDAIKRILYRPFDWRFIFYHQDVVASRSYPTMKHMLFGENIGIVASSTWTTPELFSVNVSKSLVEMKTGTHDRGTTFFPFYRFDDLMGQRSRSVNFQPSFVSQWEQTTNTKLVEQDNGNGQTAYGVRDLLHWMYACFYSPEYRARNVGALSSGFPLIPLCSDMRLINRVIALGADLVALHLLDDDYEAASWNMSQPKGKSPLKTPITRFAGKGGAEVAKGYPKYKDDNVYINPSRYFEGVPEEVWNFHVGGYQVCDKWLKDRRERTLANEDMAHYQRVVVALNETIRLMAEIDKTIEEHGGWPLAGSQKPAQKPASGGLPFA